MKTIFENVKLIVSMGMIGAILLYIATTLFMPSMTIKIFKFQPFIVVTESMEPLINVNDMVVVNTFDIDKAEVGDIITFKADIDYNGTDEVVTHYIYSIDRSKEEAIIRTNRHYETDEAVTPDTWIIRSSDVIGAYKVHIPYVGLLIGFITSVYGIVIIALNIAIIFAIKYMYRADQSIKEVSNELETMV